MTNKGISFQAIYDIMPIRRGIQVRCTYGAADCPLRKINDWNLFKCDMHLPPESALLEINIVAPDSMDSQVVQHMYGFASNVCRACIAKRNQNAL